MKLSNVVGRLFDALVASLAIGSILVLVVKEEILFKLSGMPDIDENVKEVCPHVNLAVSDRNVFVCKDCGEEVGR